ncbi:MAG: hypothetical protein ACE5Q3_00795 [Alphaproteobacteria bacterium]
MRIATPMMAAPVLALALTAQAAAQDLTWTFEEIGTGIKPALALDPDGAPHVSFLTEAIMGATFYATNKGGAWDVETVAEGYFYGPVDIDVAPDGTPFIVYHDHEASSFNPELGSGVILSRTNGAWNRAVIMDSGHDQWDADVAAEAGGVWHFAGVDPVQFGSQVGLEYATNAFGDIVVEEVGSGPIPYEFGVSIELGRDGVVGISFHDSSVLHYAERGPGPGGNWTVKTIDEEGDVGRYSDLAYDPAGNPHISYWRFDSTNGGTVRHAWRDEGGAWQAEDVGTLANVESGFTGARKITALEVDASGTPHIMYGDKAEIVYAVRGQGGGWSRQVAFSSPDARLGQLVEFDLDAEGRPHVTYFEVTNPNPLEGTVLYGTADN